MTGNSSKILDHFDNVTQYRQKHFSWFSHFHRSIYHAEFSNYANFHNTPLHQNLLFFFLQRNACHHPDPTSPIPWRTTGRFSILFFLNLQSLQRILVKHRIFIKFGRKEQWHFFFHSMKKLGKVWHISSQPWIVTCPSVLELSHAVHFAFELSTDNSLMGIEPNTAQKLLF